MKKKFISRGILVLLALLFTQCERNGLYESGTDQLLSFLTSDLKSFFSTGPDINIRAGGITYHSGGTYNFGLVTVGSTSPSVAFAIQNTGKSDLTLSGPPVVAVSGTNQADFAATDPAILILAPGGSVSFTVNFSPTIVGDESAMIVIMSDDSDEGSYVINLAGRGTAVPVPDINLQISSIDHASGGSYDFGNVMLGSSSADVNFTIQNLGPGTLTLAGPPAVAPGTDFFPSDPGVASIAPAGSASFTVTFTPSAAGARTAALTIASDDPDEWTYTITLNGTGDPLPVPDIDVQGRPAGSLCSFGTVTVNGGSAGNNFIIQNLGTAVLTLAGPPVITGTGATQFSAGTPPTFVLNPGATTSFTVNFTPTLAGYHTAMLTITSDDPDELNYTIDLDGTGGVPDIYVNDSGTDVPSGSGYGFDGVLVGDTGTAVTFTIQNVGNGYLQLMGAPFVQLAGPHATDFIVTQPTLPMLTPAASDTFTIAFAPTAGGVRTAVITIPNSDPDEDPYIITLNGTGVTQVMVVPGSGVSATCVYDPTTNTFSPGNPLSGIVNGGGTSFPVTSGLYSGQRIVLHGNASTATSLYDPSTMTFTSGPALTSSASYDAHTFPIVGGLYDGCTMVVCSGSWDTSIFDPGTNMFISGPSLSLTVGFGTMNLPVGVAGDMMVLIGNNSNWAKLYHPATNSISPGPVVPNVIFEGGHAFPITSGPQAGMYMVIEGTSMDAVIYNPSAGTFGTPSTLPLAPGAGSHSFLVSSGPDTGKVMVIAGSSTNNTLLYDPLSDSFSAGPGLTGNAGVDAFSFPITYGTYSGGFLVVHGGSQATTSIYNPATGSFIAGPSLVGAGAGYGGHWFPAK